MRGCAASNSVTLTRSPMRARRLILPLVLAALAAACVDSEPLAPTVDELAITAALNINPRSLPNYANQALPAYYAGAVTREVVGLTANPITDAGATLGRVLFYDTQLSRTNNMSCASCHAQSLAFGDSAQFSVGYEGGLTGAHSMRLTNARFNASGRYFWDKRAPSLEAQTTEPVKDSIEMGFDASHGGITVMLARLQGLPYYPPLFRLAFGTDVITETRVQQALAQYVRSILATNSKWDAGFATIPPPARQSGLHDAAAKPHGGGGAWPSVVHDGATSRRRRMPALSCGAELRPHRDLAEQRSRCREHRHLPRTLAEECRAQPSVHA